MLSDRPRRPSYTQNSPPLNPAPYSNLYNSGTATSNVYSPYPGQEPSQSHMYMMSRSPCSSPDSKSSNKNMALPTCVVAPSSVDRNSSSEDPLGYIPSRKQREFIPENRKDDSYWEKRRKNNEAARRSREKRRVHDMALEKRIMDLSRDNCQLRNELILVKKKYGLPLDEVFVSDDPDATTSGTPVIMTSHSSTSQASHATHTADMQIKYPTIPQSPVRSRNPSGAMYSPYHSSYPASQPSQYPSASPPSPPYISRADRDTEQFKAYSGKYDAQNPHSMKSMKDDTQNLRVNDQVRPVYSSVFPPNMAPPYPNTLPVSSRKSYWVSTTDMTSSDSNDEGDWNDPVQDQPLSLVKKRPSTENESGSELSNNSSRASYSPPSSSPAAALPHKLRHKLSQDYPSSTCTLPDADAPVYSNGLAQLSELALAHSNLPLTSSDDYGLQNPGGSLKIRPRSYSNPRSLFDTKYAERRKRNNEAARKCRENRKAITKIREVKSGYLESENGKLRDELSNLHDEMRELRELLEKKKKDNSVKSEPEGENAEDVSDKSIKQEVDPERESNSTSDE